MAVPTRRRPAVAPLDVLYYGIATLCLLAGAFVIWMPGLDPRMRWTIGSVLILMGIYRIVHTRMRARQDHWEEEFERMRDERQRDRPTEL